MDLVVWAADESRRSLALLESRWSYGHEAAGADEYERELLDRFDGKQAGDGRYLGGEETADAA